MTYDKKESTEIIIEDFAYSVASERAINVCLALVEEIEDALPKVSHAQQKFLTNFFREFLVKVCDEEMEKAKAMLELRKTSQYKIDIVLLAREMARNGYSMAEDLNIRALLIEESCVHAMREFVDRAASLFEPKIPIDMDQN